MFATGEDGAEEEPPPLFVASTHKDVVARPATSKNVAGTVDSAGIDEDWPGFFGDATTGACIGFDDALTTYRFIEEFPG